MQQRRAAAVQRLCLRPRAALLAVKRSGFKRLFQKLIECGEFLLMIARGPPDPRLACQGLEGAALPLQGRLEAGERGRRVFHEKER